MKKPNKRPIRTAAQNLAIAAKNRLPPQLETFLDGLDASIDGRGFDGSHQVAMEHVTRAVRYATIRHDALRQIANWQVNGKTTIPETIDELHTAIDSMKRLAKAALGS